MAASRTGASDGREKRRQSAGRRELPELSLGADGAPEKMRPAPRRRRRSTIKLCGTPVIVEGRGLKYCDKRRGHDGEHEAIIGMRKSLALSGKGKTLEERRQLVQQLEQELAEWFRGQMVPFSSSQYFILATKKGELQKARAALRRAELKKPRQG